MANYYTRLSLIMPLPNEAAQVYAINLAYKANSGSQGDQLPDDFPPFLVDMIDDWSFETEADKSPGQWGLWLHSDNGGVDAVCAFIQHLLQKFDPTGCVEFEWSNDCDKPRTDAYGGGAAIVTATEIKSMTTHQWLESARLNT